MSIRTWTPSDLGKIVFDTADDKLYKGTSTGWVEFAAEGPVGPSGAQGPQGETGATGPQGASGISAYAHMEFIRTSGTYSGFTFSGVANESLIFGNVCRITTNSQYIKASGTPTGVPGTVMCLANLSSGNAGLFMTEGFMANGLSLTVGGLIYLSPTSPGAITQVLPSGTGQDVQILGYAHHASGVYFKPDMTYIEI